MQRSTGNGRRRGARKLFNDVIKFLVNSEHGIRGVIIGGMYRYLLEFLRGFGGGRLKATLVVGA
jgi:hypothetical protein